MSEINVETAMTAAGFTFAMLRALQFSVYDAPEEEELHNMALAKARELWPWIDDAADVVEYERTKGTYG